LVEFDQRPASATPSYVARHIERSINPVDVESLVLLREL
jgi:hypothetical protein